MPKADDDPTTFNSLTTADLDTQVNHEPRINHLRLAKALGYTEAHKLAHLIERHRETLKRFGEIPSTVDGIRQGRGRRAKLLWLSKKQAIFIATKAETERATDITIQIVEVFEAVTSGTALPPPAPALTKADLDAIDQRARELGEAEERRVRAALTADALNRLRRGQPVAVAMLVVSAHTPRLLAPPVPVVQPVNLQAVWDLPFGERSFILKYCEMPPARQEQFMRLITTAAAYAESLRDLWKATAATDMWDGIVEMIESHANKFRQRIPLG